jgi:uncharacterized protein (TIGR02646 family)
MIRIQYEPEPPKLSVVRDAELQRVSALNREPSEKELAKKYQSFGPKLWAMQHRKCCYCEKAIEHTFNDVEHFRPKLRADRRPGSDLTHGYWWLAWTWENLLFACPDCNRSGKNDGFPLESGSIPLSPFEQPPGREQPLLIHPGREDPALHIRFEPVDLFGVPGSRNWHARPRNGSVKGEQTIKLLRLNRPALLDLRRQHVDFVLAPEIEDLKARIESPPSFVERWKRVLARRTESWAFYAGLSRDVLDHSFPASVRQTLGVTLP